MLQGAVSDDSRLAINQTIYLSLASALRHTSVLCIGSLRVSVRLVFLFMR